MYYFIVLRSTNAYMLRYTQAVRASQVALVVKNLPPNGGDIRSLGWEDPLEEGMATHSSIPAGESHRQRSLVDYKFMGYSPSSCKESDTTRNLAYSPCCNNRNKDKDPNNV